MTSLYALHERPVWRDRANFIINAPITESADVNMEQLWTRRVSDNRYEICCIPFFLYGLALGDIVSIRENEDGKRVLDEVVQTSTHYGFRVWFGGVDSQVKEEIMRDLTLTPVLMEVYSSNLVALDVDGDSAAEQLAGYLNDAEGEGRLVYETSRL